MGRPPARDKRPRPRGAPASGDAGGASQAQQAQPRFDIWEFRVSGNTLLKRQAVERTVYPYLGPSKTIKDVEKARKALEKRYHKAGYATVLVNIPQQKVDDGIVRLKVTEGRLGRVLVTGSHYFSLQQIRAEVPALEKGKRPLPAQGAEAAGGRQQCHPRPQHHPGAEAGAHPGHRGGGAEGERPLPPAWQRDPGRLQQHRYQLTAAQRHAAL